MTIYIGQITPETTEEDILEKFREYGEIERFELKRGYGFIDYVNKEEEENAVKECDGMVIRGEKIVVSWAHSERRGARGPSRYGREERYGRDDRYRRDDRYGRDDRYKRDDRYRRDDRYGGDDRRRDPKCYNCGSMGHMARFCRAPPHREERSKSPGDYDRPPRREESRSCSPSSYRERSPPRYYSRERPAYRGRSRSPGYGGRRGPIRGQRSERRPYSGGRREEGGSPVVYDSPVRSRSPYEKKYEGHERGSPSSNFESGYAPARSPKGESASSLASQRSEVSHQEANQEDGVDN